MYAVILHEGGRVDAVDAAGLEREALMVLRAGGAPRKYAVLSLQDRMSDAMDMAAQFRREARKAKFQVPEVTSSMSEG